MLIKDKDILADEPVTTLQKKAKKPGINKEYMRQAWGDVFDYFLRGITEKYMRFHGRASRLEFWGFSLISGVLFMLLYFLGQYADLHLLPYYYLMATALPGIAVITRRLHDINKKALIYLLLGMISFASFPFIGFYAFVPVLLWALLMLYLLSKDTDYRDGLFGGVEETDEMFGDDNIRIIRKFRFLALSVWCIIFALSFDSFNRWRTQVEYLGTKDIIMEQLKTAGQQAHMSPQQIEAAEQMMSQTIKAWSGQTVMPEDIEKAIEESLKAFATSNPVQK